MFDGENGLRDSKTVRQPKYVGKFRCIGSDCEDSCCEGSVVVVDKATFEKYRSCPDRELKVLMDDAVVPNPESRHDATFAMIAHSDEVCPFLSEKRLCSIQQRLGETYLSRTCDTYPRAINQVDGVYERSLYLSCPEAARLILLDPHAMELETVHSEPMRFGDFPSVDTNIKGSHSKPYRNLPALREFCEGLIRNRDYELWERLTILGLFCEQLNGMTSGSDSEIEDHITSYRQHIADGQFRAALDGIPSRPALQFNFAISALDHRVSSHTTGTRFLECCQQFRDGIGYTSGSPDESVQLYKQGYEDIYKPFMEAHPHMLENVLMNQMRVGLFPLGPQTGVYVEPTTIFEIYLMQVVSYTLLRSLLIGIASDAKTQFDEALLVKVIQTFTKAIDHNLPFKKQMLALLKQNGMDKMAIVAALLRN